MLSITGATEPTTGRTLFGSEFFFIKVESVKVPLISVDFSGLGRLDEWVGHVGSLSHFSK